MTVRILLAVLVGLTVGTPLFAADDEQAFVTKVNKAIERGKKFLLEREGGRGNWEGILLESLADQTGGQSALATLALLNAGVSPDDKVMQRALTYLRSLEPRKTYVVGLTTMALAEARQPKDLNRIGANAKWLLDNAIYRGEQLVGWSYPMNPIPDASNTQYALLGMYAARQAGVKIPDKFWKDVREMYKNQQHESGYWSYAVGRQFGNFASQSFTMTVAGVCGLHIANMGLNESQQKLNEATGVAANCGVYSANPNLAKGMTWIAERFSFDAVPGLKSVYYNVYGLERLGRLSGQRFIGKADWYREGCEYLIRAQNDDGSWSRPDHLPDRMPNIATSFALLFLSKGKTPILMTKFAFDTGLGEPAGVIGWNRKQNDVRHLVDFASREMFNGLPMGWQVYDPRKTGIDSTDARGEVESLLACPIVYFNGHSRPNLTGVQKEILKKYVDEGGFLFAEACCGSEEFATEFRALMRELFPENQLVPMAPEHPVWRSFFNVSPADVPGVECLERGCKTVVVLATKPLAGYWEENRFMVSKGVPAKNRGERAYQFAGNVIAYATGLQPPEQRGTRVAIADPKADLSPPRGAFKPAQLLVRGETPPAPAAMRNLMSYLKASSGLEAVLDKQAIRPNDLELVKYKFVYLHGRKKLELTPDELANIATMLDTGGLLFADACCGKPEFDASFREMVKKLLPDTKLEAIPPDDELYSQEMNGVAIRTVIRREKAEAAGGGGDGYLERPPALEGIKVNGRWVVIYSKYDIGCALERHKSTDCLGHTPESAQRLAAAAVLYSLKR